MDGIQNLNELRANANESTTITIPALLFCDLVEATGWAINLAEEKHQGATLAIHPDPDAIEYLASEAQAIYQRASVGAGA